MSGGLACFYLTTEQSRFLDDSTRAKTKSTASVNGMTSLEKRLR